jgi:hypothetical protein
VLSNTNMQTPEVVCGLGLGAEYEAQPGLTKIPPRHWCCGVHLQVWVAVTREQLQAAGAHCLRAAIPIHLEISLCRHLNGIGINVTVWLVLEPQVGL